jgi:hypothetical protein
LEWGLSAQVVPSRIRIRGALSVDPLSPEIVDQVQLRRNGESANNVTLSLPLPLTVREGVRYRHLRRGREVFDVELDVTYDFWSRANRFTMDGDGLSAYLLNQRVDVGRIDIEKHWRNTVTIALGGDYALIPKGITLRGGLSYISAVADPGYANVDFVGGRQLGSAIGTSVFIGGAELAFAYQYRYQLPVTVTENNSRVFQEAPGSQCRAPYTDPGTCNAHFLGLPAPPVNPGTYRAYSHIASLDLLYRF